MAEVWGWRQCDPELAFMGPSSHLFGTQTWSFWNASDAWPVGTQNGWLLGGFMSGMKYYHPLSVGMNS